MRVSVLGAIVYDEIITHRGERKESYGGITYNVAAFSSIVSDDAAVVPLSNVGDDHFDRIVSLLSSYPHVDLSELRRTKGRLTHAKLVYTSATWRDESVKYMMTPFTPDRIASCKTSDAILVNFVNGSEMDIDTFAGLRRNTKRVVYVDVHSKISRWDEHGKKTLVQFSDWREWVQHLDIIQMNEFECELVVGRKLSDRGDFIRAASEILDAGAQIVIVTLGPLGSVLAHRTDGKRYVLVCPAAEVNNVVDTTGCGDSFSAGFLWNYVRCGNPVKSNAAANIVAAINCQTAGVGHLEMARNALDQIPRWFPDLARKLDAGYLGEEM